MNTGVAAFVSRPFRARTWRDTAYLLLGALTAAVAFTCLVVALTVGPIMALTIIALPVLLACFALTRWAADFDRWRAGIVTGRPIGRRYKPPRDRRLLSR